MTKSNVVPLAKPSQFSPDPLTEVIRNGARELLGAAVQAEISEFLAFHDFPAEHRKHIGTTNPIESVFATVGNRTRKTKGCLSRKTAPAMVFGLMMPARLKWRKLSGPNRMAEVIRGVEFRDGITQVQTAARRGASSGFGHISIPRGHRQ